DPGQPPLRESDLGVANVAPNRPPPGGDRHGQRRPRTGERVADQAPRRAERADKKLGEPLRERGLVLVAELAAHVSATHGPTIHNVSRVRLLGRGVALAGLATGAVRPYVAPLLLGGVLLGVDPVDPAAVLLAVARVAAGAVLRW